MSTRYALRPNTQLPTIYLYRNAVDFRKSHRGLAAIVQMELSHDPFGGMLYVFRNRAFNKLKILFWENNGFVLYYKSLAEEKFHWPDANESLLTINGEQLNWLLDGYNIARMKPHKVLRYESVC
jgi:transposase